MIKKLIPVIFFLNFYLPQSAFGQIKFNIPDYIRNRFQNYCKSVPREEIFIHTDREEYISGEDLWFSIYLIDRQNFKPSSDSKIAYVEILNAENSPVVQKRLLIDKGFGPGQVVLPDTLSTGIYTLRAYTNWMKNFLPYDCFQKEIKVYNSLRTKTFRRSLRSMEMKGKETGIRPSGPGLNLKVNNLRQDSLEIFVYTEEKFRSENENLIYLFIQTHGVINHLSTEKTEGEIRRITVPKNSLIPGINQITIFDSKGPVAERYIYTPVMKKQFLTLHSPDSSKQRNKVALDIDIGDDLPRISDLTNLSISVAAGQHVTEVSDLNDYLVFGTEFGFLSADILKGGKITDVPPEMMDSLLLTLNSNWIIWDSIFSNDTKVFKYPHEKEYHYLSGRLLTGNLQPVKTDETLLMSIPGREAVFQYTRTDANGNFNFRVHIDEELKDLILQPDINSKNQIISVESSFSDLYLPAKIFVDTTNRPVPSFISRLNISYQVRKIYGSSSIGVRITPFIPPLKPKRFYGIPDFELIIKNFIMLDSMHEVFFELVPRVALESINSDYKMLIFDPVKNKLEGSPVVMIDGVIIKNLSLIARLDPGLVEKIDVVWDKYRVGGYLFNGIVNIISKRGDFTNETLPADAVRLHYRVINTVSSFVSPEYSSAEMKNSPIADYRNTLYWNPSVHPDEKGKARIEFWTADNKSDYIISINGITNEGKTISLRKSFKVR